MRSKLAKLGIGSGLGVGFGSRIEGMVRVLGLRGKDGAGGVSMSNGKSIRSCDSVVWFGLGSSSVCLFPFYAET